MEERTGQHRGRGERLAAVRAVLAVIVRPRLWGTALRQLGAIAPRRWWRHPPFLPIPERRYLEFRLQTQYGPDADVDPADVVTYLEWCKQSRR
ncbi:MAG: hypothetical protein JJE46_05805 [Acidimicrobiia bacterium]|nr:hypothetical protein [Acidimicrobiia bacterium]